VEQDEAQGERGWNRMKHKERGGGTG
jgi:hypothetical protein